MGFSEDSTGCMCIVETFPHPAPALHNNNNDNNNSSTLIIL